VANDGAGTSVVRRPPFGTNPLVGERGNDTRRRILAAALEVFAETGFNGARVELITERAGCSRPALYQYFSSKDDVFWQLAGEVGEEMVELAQQLPKVTPDTEGLAALTAWVDAFMELHATYAPVFSAFQAASRDHQPTARRSSAISDRTGDALLRAFGTRRTKRTGTLVTGLVAVLIRCSLYAEHLTGAARRRPLVDGLAQLLHRTFFGRIDGVNVTRPPGQGGRRAAGAAPDLPEPGGRPLRPRGEKTRQRLLDAGASVLPSRGFHDARVDDIVEAAGVSHGTFYRYFAHKDDFFRVLAEASVNPMVEMLDDLRPGADEGELRAWLRDWFDVYEGNGGVISTWQEMRTRDDLAAFSQQVGLAVIARLSRVLEPRGFGDPDIDAVILLALIERIPYSVFTLRFADRDGAIDAMVTVLHRGFMGFTDPP
jgi:AcrR family transcriptional regulator